MRIGSVFTGYGGLDMAVEAVLGATPAWFVEFDQAPSKILAHHWPTVPNYGDVTTVDWANVESVDVLTGGSPCQDLSHAGKRAGMTEGTRSNLWVAMREAIAALRPSLVVWENVRGAYSAPADSAVGYGPRLLGGADGGPPLRALGRVLGDLSDLGYDSRWVGLRAADVGAPHGRFRVFVVAHPAGVAPLADPHCSGGRKAEQFDGSGEAAHYRPSVPDESDRDAGGAGPDRESMSVGPQAPQPVTLGAGVRPEVACVGVDGSISDLERGGGHASTMPVLADDLSSPRLLPTPAARAFKDGALDDAGGVGRHRPGATDTVPRAVLSLGASFGPYAPAIARWEAVLGRPAPSPTEPGKDGRPRLSPAFVEWMMGLPAGHVTDPAIGLTLAQQLKALGNGVVPAQAAAALRFLLWGEPVGVGTGAARKALPTPTARLGDSRGSSHPDRRKELCAKRSGELDEVVEHCLPTGPT